MENLGLNPCFNGIPSLTETLDEVVQENFVLILVLMEYLL